MSNTGASSVFVNYDGRAQAARSSVRNVRTGSTPCSSPPFTVGGRRLHRRRDGAARARPRRGARRCRVGQHHRGCALQAPLAHRPPRRPELAGNQTAWERRPGRQRHGHSRTPGPPPDRPRTSAEEAPHGERDRRYPEEEHDALLGSGAPEPAEHRGP
ncbi:hypothetical protein HBB16_02775 [Pseudonocardia sp. MCCB 268]|nr:hypothetical protein [Pseudonocardia cytotoxica]